MCVCIYVCVCVCGGSWFVQVYFFSGLFAWLSLFSYLFMYIYLYEHALLDVLPHFSMYFWCYVGHLAVVISILFHDTTMWWLDWQNKCSVPSQVVVAASGAPGPQQQQQTFVTCPTQLVDFTAGDPVLQGTESLLKASAEILQTAQAETHSLQTPWMCLLWQCQWGRGMRGFGVWVEVGKYVVQNLQEVLLMHVLYKPPECIYFERGWWWWWKNKGYGRCISTETEN